MSGADREPIAHFSQRAPNSPAGSIARAEEYLAQLAERDQLSGAVLIGRGGQPLLSRGYGLSNIEQATLNTPQTSFQIASITKQFTALAILILHEQGRLQLTDSLALQLPGCLPAWQPVTIHQLLTHTSGIPDLPFWPQRRDPSGPGPITPPYLHELFTARPLESTPGTRFRYSNWGYLLLGAIIEHCSGLPYATFLRRSIFEPAGMAGTGYADPRAIILQRAASYAVADDALVNASFMDLEDAYAAGALCSTVEDLLAWDRALSSDRLVTHAALDAMFTPHVAVGDGSDYGYGWQLALRLERSVVYHGGRIDGFRVLIERYPAEQICIVVLSNVAQVEPEPIAQELAQIIFR